jgi:hypothetical protein
MTWKVNLNKKNYATFCENKGIVSLRNFYKNFIIKV